MIDVTGVLPFRGKDVTCDATYWVVGSPYEGDCPACDYNFLIQWSREERDEGNDCPNVREFGPFIGFWQSNFFSWGFGQGWWNLHTVLQFTEHWSGTGYWGGDIDNEPALLWSVVFQKNLYRYPVAYDKSILGSVDVDGDEISWTMDWNGTMAYYSGYPYYTEADQIHVEASGYIVPD
jgi:hypothetical protein